MVIGIQSIECVNTEADFISSLNNVAKMLESNGKFLLMILRYKKVTNFTRKMIESNMEGLLNPNLKKLEQLFNNSNLTTTKISVFELNQEINYHEAIFIEAKLR